MTYLEMEALVRKGIWTKEVLAAQPEGTNIAVKSGTQLSKNINKFQFFALETAHNDEIGTVIPHKDTLLLNRDYINKWTIEHSNALDEVYSIEGYFGDEGEKIYISRRRFPEDNSYNDSIYIRAVYGYRPTRKIIYVYNIKPGEGGGGDDKYIYLISEDNKYLYTVDSEKLVAQEN